MDKFDSAIDEIYSPQKATQAATAASAVPPDAAAKAIKIAPQEPASVMYDLEPQAQVHQQQKNGQLIQMSPALARWSHGDPAHVAASADQFDWLHSFSKVLDETKKMVLAPEEQRPKGNLGQVFLSGAAATPGEIVKQFHVGKEALLHPQEPAKLPKEYSAASQLDDWLAQYVPGVSALQRATADVGTRAFGALQAAFSPILGAATQAVGQPVEALTGVRRQIVGNVLTMALPLGFGLKGRGAAEEAGPATESQTVLDALHQATQKAPLQARSPETMREFIRQNTEGTAVDTVHISGEAIKKLYDDAGAAPSEGDGRLGWIPNLGEKLSSALSNGGDVSVPLADYLTKVDEPTHQALKNDIGFAGADSVTAEKEASETEAKPLEEEAKPTLLERAKAAVGIAPPTENVTVPKEVRAAANKAAESYWLGQLFKDAKSAGMEKEQFARYSKAIEARLKVVQEKLAAQVQRQGEKEMSVEWRALAKQVEPAVRDEMSNDPAILARHYLQYGELPDGTKGVFGDLKLARDTVDNPDDLPRGIFGPEGVAPDDVAELFGFNSGEEMLAGIKALHDSKPEGLSAKDHFEKIIKDEVNRRVAEQGSALSPMAVEDLMREALTGPEARNLLVQELQALAKQSGLPFDKARVEAFAERSFGQERTADAANIKRWERYAFKNGRRAEVALLKGKPDEAFRAKQQQLLNTHMLAQAHDFSKEYKSGLSRLKHYAERSTVGGMVQEYLNAIHSILQSSGYRIARDPDELANAMHGQSYTDFIDERNAEGAEIVEGPLLVKPPFKDASVEDFRAYSDMVKSLAHVGREEKSIETTLGKMDFETILHQAKVEFADFGKRFTREDFSNTTVRQKVASAMRGADAAMLNFETMLDFFDRFDPKGVFNRVVSLPVVRAKGLENSLLAPLRKDLQEFAKTLPKRWGKGLRQKVALAHEYDGEPIFQRKSDVVAFALNWGNESNKGKLLDGWGLTEAEGQAVLDKHMTKPDWDFVQKIWDSFETYWPLAESLYRDLSGIAPPKMKKVSVATPHGAYPGGYWPVIYDEILAPEAGRPSYEGQLYDDRFFRATPPNRYAHARTGHVAPISLRFDSFPARIEQVVHDISYRKTVLSAAKLLMHPTVRKGIREGLGKEYEDQILPWLRAVANQRVYDDRSTAFFDNAFKRSNAAVTMVGLGYRIATAAMHGLSATALSAAEVKTVPFAKALWQTWATPWRAKRVIQFINSKSVEMPHRIQNWDRDVRESYKLMFERQGFVGLSQHYAYHMIAGSDLFSAYPTWYAAYSEALKSMPETQAIAVADKAVRRAHGSGAPQDLAAVQRKQWLRPFTLFMTFMNRMYNSDRITYQLTKRAIETKRDFGRPLARAMYSFVTVAMVHELMKGGSSDDPLTEFAEAVGYRLVAPMPFARDAYSAIVRGYDYEFSPLGNAVKTVLQTGTDVKKVVTGDNVSSAWLRHAMETIGYFTRTPTGQAAVSSQYLYNTATGREKPKDIDDFIHGLVYGKGRK